MQKMSAIIVDLRVTCCGYIDMLIGYIILILPYGAKISTCPHKIYCKLLADIIVAYISLRIRCLEPVEHVAGRKRVVPYTHESKWERRSHKRSLREFFLKNVIVIYLQIVILCKTGSF